MKKRYVRNSVAGLSALALVGMASGAMAAGLGFGDDYEALTYAEEISGTVDVAGGGLEDENVLKAEVGKTYYSTAYPYFQLICTEDFSTLPGLTVDASGDGITSIDGDQTLGSADEVVWELEIGDPAVDDDEEEAGAIIVDDEGNVYFTDAAWTVTSGNSLSCTYYLYDTLGKYDQGNYAKMKTSGDLIAWDSGLVVKAEKTKATIDNGADALKFVDDATIAPIGGLELTVDTTVYDVDGELLEDFEDIVNTGSDDTDVVVTGDFSAVTDVWVAEGDCGTTVGTDTGTINEAKTSATFAGSVIGDGSWTLCAQVDGETTLMPGYFTAVLNIDPMEGYDNAPDSVDLGTIGEWDENGSSDWLQFVLSPGGYFTGYVRVSHIGGDEGDISFYLVNDDGEGVTVEMGDVSGQSTSTLAANASTTQIALSDLYDAGVAADATWDKTGEGKLRIKVVSTSTTGVNASTFNLSLDGNAFQLMNDDSVIDAVDYDAIEDMIDGAVDAD